MPICYEIIDQKEALIGGRVEFSTSEELEIFVVNLASKDFPKDFNIPSSELYENIDKTIKNKRVIPELDSEGKPASRTTAILEYDTRRAIINAVTGTKFILANAGNYESAAKGKRLNINEYEKLNNISIGGLEAKDLGEGYRIHLGNFSIIYEIQLLGVIGKRIKIIPNTNVIKTSCVLMYPDPNSTENKWGHTEINKKEWIIPVPKDGAFKFLLPGSTYGDVLFEIIN